MYSLKTDVSGAKILKCNRSPKKVFQGQTHGHKGFLVPKSEAKVLLVQHPEYADISCARVTKRPIFQFISSEIRPNDALMVFAFEDDYSFGIINSKYHWEWFREKCSTLKGDWRYTTDSVWDTFPWPQNPSTVQIEEVAKAAKALRYERNRIMVENKMSLRDLYRLMEKPGKNPVRDLQDALDRAVSKAYGFDKNGGLLEQLLKLNLKIAEREQNGEPMQAPGLPDWFENKEKLISDDCVRFEW